MHWLSFGLGVLAGAALVATIVAYGVISLGRSYGYREED